MASDESPLVRDILMSDAGMHNLNEDSLFHIDFFNFDVQIDDKTLMSSFDFFPLNYPKEEEDIPIERMSVDQCFSDSNMDFPKNSSISSFNPSICSNLQQYIVPNCSSPNDFNFSSCRSLTFSNPPEPIYHVRYLSEITNSPLDGNIVNTKKKTKKNVSGRYLKGTHGRHVTIELPTNLSDYVDYYIRVTRLTVPYQNITYIHPYPLLYSPPKKKTNTDIIMKSSSIYFKLNKEQLCSHSKQFPNIILTRLKQCKIKETDILIIYVVIIGQMPFIGNNPKTKIANYQLKKSHLDFRLVIKYNGIEEFKDLNISCRSNALLEEEGTECRKLSISPSL